MTVSMTAETVLRRRIENDLDLPPDAVAWLMDLWNATQVFDDVADGDPVDRGQLDRAIWACLVGFASNSFYRAHNAWLTPVLANFVACWQASDLAEREGNADPRSYMWRAGYYEVVAAVVTLVHGPKPEWIYAALNLYGEPLQDYMAEFHQDG